MEAVALFSFTAAEPDEISFQKGDVIKVTELDSCWATAELHGRRGFIPENFVSLLPHPWFAGPVSRLEAERRLRWQEAGVFLVRESESAPGEFSVSVSYGDRVEHFRVLEGGGQYCIWEETFSSLNRLVDFYRHHSIGVDTPLYLRDAPAEPSSPGQNPYPNPYCVSGSQESLTPARRRHLEPLLKVQNRAEGWTSGRTETCVCVCPQKPGLAHALLDFTPSNPSHLHFLRGDLIELLDCSGPTWRGRCRGRVGIFPPEYVQPLHQ
ncbi:LOW QUALITY PROTEIN: GRB2-related adapter protein-like [Neosynchiropus ocellatus]